MSSIKQVGACGVTVDCEEDNTTNNNSHQHDKREYNSSDGSNGSSIKKRRKGVVENYYNGGVGGVDTNGKEKEETAPSSPSSIPLRDLTNHRNSTHTSLLLNENDDDDDDSISLPSNSDFDLLGDDLFGDHYFSDYEDDPPSEENQIEICEGGTVDTVNDTGDVPHSKFFCRQCENLSLPIGGKRGIVTCPACSNDVCDTCLPVGYMQCKHCTPENDAESDASDNEDENSEDELCTFEDVGNHLRRDYTGVKIKKCRGDCQGFEARVILPRNGSLKQQEFTVGLCALPITALIGQEILAYILGRVPVSVVDIHTMKVVYEEQKELLQSVTLPDLVSSRADFTSFQSMLQYVVDCFESERWNKRMLKNAERNVALAVFKRLLAAESNGTYDTCNIELPWVGVGLEIPLDLTMPKKKKGEPFNVRELDVGLRTYFCMPANSGGHVTPIGFRPNGGLSEAINNQKKLDLVNFAARCVFENLMDMIDTEAEIKTMMPKYMSADQIINPDTISVIEKQDILLRFLHGEGWIPEWFTPIILKQSTTFDPNALDAEVDIAYNILGEMLQKELERLDRELQAMEEALAGRPERLAKLRAKVDMHNNLFQFMAESQNDKKYTNLPISSFEEWKTTFMTHLKAVEGMDHVKKFEDIASTFDEATWKNKEHKKERNNALGKLACDVLKHFCDECELGDEVCGARISDYPPAMWAAFNLGHQHPELKSDNPSNIANEQGIMALVDELMNEDDVGGGVLNVCPDHHDCGESRQFTLETIKRLRLLSRPKADRTEHRTINDVFADVKSRFMFSLYIIENHVRGSHAYKVAFRQSTERVLDLVFFGELTDDYKLCSAVHHNTDPSVNPHIETQRKMIRLHKHESRVCASATAMIREGSNEYVCKDKDYCLLNTPAFGYYSIDNDHKDEDKKNREIAKLAGGNIITLLNELGLTKATTKYSHKARNLQQTKGVKGLCYYID